MFANYDFDMSDVAKLSIISGFNRGRYVRASVGQSFVVGRRSTSDLHVMDPRISREHFRFEHDGESWTIVDLQSRAGTLVNGEQVELRSLEHADIISAGDTNFRFEIEESLMQADESTAKKTPLLVRLNPFKRANASTLMLSEPQVSYLFATSAQTSG